MIPELLDEWTLPQLTHLVRAGVFESDRFDFKEALPHSRDQHSKVRLRKACCAFANSAGGFLVFGVKDDRTVSAEDRIVGLEASIDFPEAFGNFPNAAEPSVEWAFKNPPLVLSSGRVVHVVYVPPSDIGPHGLFHDERWSFTKRTSKGNESMSHRELRAQFFDVNELRGELDWVISEFARIEALASQQNNELYHQRWTPEVLGARFNVVDLRSSIRRLSRTLRQADTSLPALAADVISRCATADATMSAVEPHVFHSFRTVQGDGLELLKHANNQVRRIAIMASQAITGLKRVETLLGA